MKSDIINEAIKKIDADLVRDAAAYGSGSGTEQAKRSRTPAGGKRWKTAVAVAATALLLVGGITAGIILGIRNHGRSTPGIPGTQPVPVPGTSSEPGNDIKEISPEELKSVLLGLKSFEESEALLKNLKWKYRGKLLDASMTTRYLYVFRGYEGAIVVITPIINLNDMSFRIDFENSTYLIMEDGTVNAKTKEAPDAETLLKLNNTLFFDVDVRSDMDEEALMKNYNSTWEFETYDQYIAKAANENDSSETEHVPGEPTPSPIP